MCESHHHHEGHECGCHEGHGHHEGDCGCGGHGHGEHEEGCGCEGHHGHHPEHQHHGPGYFAGHQGSCCHGRGEWSFGFHRHFRSGAERISELEAYLKELEAEAQGVREHVDALRSTRAQPGAE